METMNTMQKELIVRGYSKQTIKSYQFHNNAFLKIIKKSPRQVTRKDIKYYIQCLIENGYERATINLVINALKFYYSEILNRKFEIKRLRTQKKLLPALSKNEVQRMFDSATNIKHKMLLKVLYYTGIRLSEARNLKIRDIDFERMQIHIRCGKGNKDRFVTLNERLKIELINYLKNISENQYLFETSHGKYSMRSIQKICQTYSKKVGISKKVTPHTFRRTFATHLIENKNYIGKVSRLMGHKNVNTTMGYIDYARINLSVDL
jgi:integrase/recombinase XerD